MTKEEYKKYLNSNHWKCLKAWRLYADNYKCVRCGSERDLEVHHITYERIYKEKLKDVITLCNICHENEHFYKGDKIVIDTIIKLSKKLNVNQIEDNKKGE